MLPVTIESLKKIKDLFIIPLCLVDRMIHYLQLHYYQMHVKDLLIRGKDSYILKKEDPLIQEDHNVQQVFVVIERVA